MTTAPRYLPFLAIGLALFASNLRAELITLQWGVNATWTPESLTGSFDIDASNPGVDFTITLTPLGGAAFTSSFPSVVGSDLTWDLSNLTDTRNVQVTLSFHYLSGVSQISFLTGGVDEPSASRTEVVKNIFGDFQGGTVMPVTDIAPGIDQVVSGVGTLGALLSGTSDDAGANTEALFTFTTVPLDRVQFVFSRQDGDPGGGTSAMRLGFIQFETSTPEPAAYALFASGLMALGWLGRRRIVR